MAGGKQHLMQQALAALLSTPTLADAARVAGISERTLRYWLKRPKFLAAYRRARRQLVEAAVARLQQIAWEAAEALRRNLTCGQPSNEIRAALGVLEQAAKGIELVDLAEQVEELRNLVEGAWP
jgi:hypothetical protein